jgi:hypothetical protein
MAMIAVAAPAAPAAIPSPERVVVVVLVPSAAMVSVTVQDVKVKTTEARAKAREWRSIMVSFGARMFIEGAGIGIDDAGVLFDGDLQTGVGVGKLFGGFELGKFVVCVFFVSCRLAFFHLFVLYGIAV